MAGRGLKIIKYQTPTCCMLEDKPIIKAICPFFIEGGKKEPRITNKCVVMRHVVDADFGTHYYLQS